jgi:AcrR family transcriptional regulator
VSDGRKRTQRQRLLDATRTAVLTDGYPEASIARVIELAGVSRRTFYEHFHDKEACFVASLLPARERLVAAIESALAAAPAAEAMPAAMQALIAFVAAEPQLARLVMVEAIAGGPRVLDARDQITRELAAAVEAAEDRASASARTPDLAPQLLFGGLFRLLGARLRADVGDVDGVADQLLPWLASYRRPRGAQRWRTLDAAVAPPPWPLLPEMLLRAPPPLTPRRARRREDLVENQRLRILFATAEVARERGYTASTVARIIDRAGVERRVFNALFASKQEAFMSVHELAFQRTMALTVGAFTGATWPDRVWDAGRAFVQYFQSNEAIAHVGFVDSYAVGPDAIERVEASHAAFTIFLQEGRRAGNAGATGPIALQAIAATIFEIAYREARRGDGAALASLLAHLAFLCLAPFLAASEVDRFVDGRIAETGRRCASGA